MRKFNFPIGVLVAAGHFGWLKCKNGVTDFALLRAIYTLLYIQGKTDALTALSEMPDEFQRSIIHERLKLDMENKAKAGLKAWRRLRRYCINGFPPALRSMMLKDMGREYLKGALNDNWTALAEMLIKGGTFIEGHEAELLANENMPLTFKDEYNHVKDAYLQAKVLFYNSESDAETLTVTVNTAANAVYDDLMAMLEDGQAVYENQPLANQFTMGYLLSIVTPTGPAGLKGTAEMNGQPAVGIIVELENKKLSVVVDAEGAFSFGENLASGKDKLIFKKGDQILFQEEVDIPPGTTVTEHVVIP